MTDFDDLDPDVATHDAEAAWEGPVVGELVAAGVGPTGIVKGILTAITQNLVAVLLVGAGVVGGAAWALSQPPLPRVMGPAGGGGHSVALTQAAQAAMDPAPGPAAASVGGPVLRPSVGAGGGVAKWGDDHVTLHGGTLRSIMSAAFRMNPSQVQFHGDEPTDVFDVDLTGDDWPEVLRDALKREMGVVASRETRRFPAYALRATAAPPHRLGPGLKQRVHPSSYVWSDRPRGRLIRPIVNSDQLAALIALRLGHRVVDQTGLMGTYAVDMQLPQGFHLSPEALDAFVRSGQVVSDADVAAFADAVRRELGLELVDIEGGHPFEVLVVRADATAVTTAGPTVGR